VFGWWCWWGGISGSGKSFVANVFRKEWWAVVSPDELGDRQKCKAAERKATPYRIELKLVRSLTIPTLKCGGYEWCLQQCALPLER
jgi:hypothetical protein